MRILLTALALVIAAPALAQTAAPAAAPTAAAPLAASALRRGQSVVDANNIAIGSVDRVTAGADGAVTSVKIILGSRFVTLPASSLAIVNGKLTTSLSRSELNKLP